MYLSSASPTHFNPDIVTNDDLAIISNTAPDSTTGYFGVFVHRGRYRAIAFHLRIGEAQITPRAAAIQLVRFWKYWFGPSWASCFRAKKGHAWSIVPTDDGFRVLVYMLGRPFFLGCKRRKKRTTWLPVLGRGHVFATKEEAGKAYRLFVWWRYGMFEKLAGLEIRRDSFAVKKAKPQVPRRHGR